MTVSAVTLAGVVEADPAVHEHPDYPVPRCGWCQVSIVPASHIWPPFECCEDMGAPDARGRLLRRRSLAEVTFPG